MQEADAQICQRIASVYTAATDALRFGQRMTKLFDKCSVPLERRLSSGQEAYDA